MNTSNPSSFILDVDYAPPKYIEGVGVFRNGASHEKYQPYIFQSSVLVPGNHCCFPTPGLGLRLRIYCPFDSPLESSPYSHACPVRSLTFSSEGPEGRPVVPGDEKVRGGPLVIFRKDYKPLQPKQVEVLWRYLRYFKHGTGPIYSGYGLGSYHTFSANGALRYPPLNRISRAIDVIQGEAWHYEELTRAYFTINNFHAFFHVTRHRRLCGGDESWRGVNSLYDDE